ncbi:MAG: hypothetical protein ABI682_14920, partial [Acidobacteriota bacterium]
HRRAARPDAASTARLVPPLHPAPVTRGSLPFGQETPLVTSVVATVAMETSHSPRAGSGSR